MSSSSVAVIAAALSCLLVGCAPEVTTPVSSEEPESTQDAVEDDVAAWDVVEESEPARPVLSDKDIMASMAAEELGEDAVVALGKYGYFERAVSVEVGEANGTMWRVVAADARTGAGSEGSAYLTDALVQGGDICGTWIELADADPWKNVGWDHDMLVRGQSALVLAKSSLKEAAWVR